MGPRHAGCLRIITAGVVVASLLLVQETALGGPHPLAVHAQQRTAPRARIGLNRAVFLAVDAHGALYVSDFYNDRVVKLSSRGALLAAWPTEHRTPVGVAVDGREHVYVTLDSHIWLYSSTGVRLADWTIPVVHIGALELRALLEGVALDTEGNIYVTDLVSGVIWKLSARGIVLAHWAVLKPQQTAEPTGGGIAADSQNHLYAVDQRNNRVVKLSVQGRVLAAWGPGSASRISFAHPTSVAVDRHDALYIGDSGNHRIVKLSAQGTVLARWGTTGLRPGQFIGNLFVAVGPGDMVYVTDDTNNTVQTFSPLGRLVASWS